MDSSLVRIAEGSFDLAGIASRGNHHKRVPFLAVEVNRDLGTGTGRSIPFVNPGAVVAVDDDPEAVSRAIDHAVERDLEAAAAGRGAVDPGARGVGLTHGAGRHTGELQSLKSGAEDRQSLDRSSSGVDGGRRLRRGGTVAASCEHERDEERCSD